MRTLPRAPGTAGHICEVPPAGAPSGRAGALNGPTVQLSLIHI
ncbi:hypothetical protein [Arthrobacter sp. KBS0703]|nr:hypothetical protein [Arthrobacter sp. KBS0703]